MELRINIPSVADVKASFAQAKYFFAKSGLIGLAYLLCAYMGTYISPFILADKLFEIPAIALAAVLAVKYRWAGIFGAVIGSLLFHLFDMPFSLALNLAASTAAAAFLFSYLFRLFSASEVINKVSSVAAFVFVATPLACLAHTIFALVSMQTNGWVEFDYALKNGLSWWFDELLIAYLTVPLLLSLFAHKKMFFSINEKIEAAAIFVGMAIAVWLLMHYTQLLGTSDTIIFVLLAFVLWASLRFKIIVAHVVIFIAAIIAFMAIVYSENSLDSASYTHAVFTLKYGLLALALGGLFVAAAFSERHNAEAELNQLANHDPLTGLPNRAYFHDFIIRSLAHAQRQKHQVYLLFIDLDRFKKINDSQGHDVGDEVLKIIANRLNDILRGDDFVARLGGDEFAVIYTHPPVNNAASNLARKIIGIVSEPFDIGDRRYNVGASIGISVYPNDAKDASALLRQADLAMYQAKSKQSGFEYFSDEMNVLAHEQLQIENGLRHALDHDELLLVYQPKVDLRTSQVVGVEALVRWQTNDGILIGPDKFIPIAEEAGLIIPIGRYVIRAACEQWVKWNDALLYPPAIAVNISPRQFSDPALLNDIRSIIQTTGMEPSMLHVEITESATMDDPEMTMEILQAMRELNLHLYIDDFGTGHSNLSQLRRLPIDAVKIDKSFINEVLSNDDDAEIVLAIINLAHALKLRVVCEGIETKAQLDLLRGLGCDEIQGYLITKPLQHDKIPTFFNRKIGL
jgi:diguanylate cyclase